MRVLAFVLVVTIAASSVQAEHREFETDLLIVGGTESGWAAAIQAARQGVKSVTIVHDGEWLGGQFTEQALACVDENKGVGLVGWGVDWHPMKRSFHRSGLFKELMDRIEAFKSRRLIRRSTARRCQGDRITGHRRFAPLKRRRFFEPCCSRISTRARSDSSQIAIRCGQMFPSSTSGRN